MDNKNNRQFFWEVKQFFNGNSLNESKKTPQKGILDTVKGVMGSRSNIDGPNSYAVREAIKHSSSGLKNLTSNLLYNYGSQKIKDQTNSPGNSKNSVSNLFNLSEAVTMKRQSPSLEREIGLMAQKQDMANQQTDSNVGDEGMEQSLSGQPSMPADELTPKHAIPGISPSPSLKTKKENLLKNLHKAKLSLNDELNNKINANLKKTNVLPTENY